MNINKFVNNTDGSVFHSTGYADVAHGDSIGSTSSQSFGQRKHLERNRQSVRRYSDSMLAGGHVMREAFRPRPPAADTSPSDRRRAAKAPLRPPGVHSTPRRSFTNPGGRGYNPYS